MLRPDRACAAISRKYSHLERIKCKAQTCGFTIAVRCLQVTLKKFRRLPNDLCSHQSKGGSVGSAAFNCGRTGAGEGTYLHVASRDCLTASVDLLNSKLTKITRSQFQAAELSVETSCTGTAAVCFSSDSKRFAFSRNDHNIQIFDAVTRKRMKVLQGHHRTPMCLRFHPCDHNIVISSCFGNHEHPAEVKLWDITNDRVRTATCGDNPYAVEFHPSGNIALIAAGGLVLLWDLQCEGDELQPIARFNNLVRCVAFDASGEFVVVAEESEARFTAGEFISSNVYRWRFHLSHLERFRANPATVHVGTQPHLRACEFHSPTPPSTPAARPSISASSIEATPHYNTGVATPQVLCRAHPPHFSVTSDSSRSFVSPPFVPRTSFLQSTGDRTSGGSSVLQALTVVRQTPVTVSSSLPTRSRRCSTTDGDISPLRPRALEAPAPSGLPAQTYLSPEAACTAISGSKRKSSTRSSTSADSCSRSHKLLKVSPVQRARALSSDSVMSIPNVEFMSGTHDPPYLISSPALVATGAVVYNREGVDISSDGTAVAVAVVQQQTAGGVDSPPGHEATVGERFRARLQQMVRQLHSDAQETQRMEVRVMELQPVPQTSLAQQLQCTHRIVVNEAAQGRVVSVKFSPSAAHVLLALDHAPSRRIAGHATPFPVMLGYAISSGAIVCHHADDTDDFNIAIFSPCGSKIIVGSRFGFVYVYP